jgi:hypothetical protein
MRGQLKNWLKVCHGPWNSDWKTSISSLPASFCSPGSEVIHLNGSRNGRELGNGKSRGKFVAGSRNPLCRVILGNIALYDIF